MADFQHYYHYYYFLKMVLIVLNIVPGKNRCNSVMAEIQVVSKISANMKCEYLHTAHCKEGNCLCALFSGTCMFCNAKKKSIVLLFRVGTAQIIVQCVCVLELGNLHWHSHFGGERAI